MNQTTLFLIKTLDGYLNNNFNFSKDINEACLFNSERSAQTIVEDAFDTMKSPTVVKVLKTVYLTPII